jgi:hypothetical protein
MAEGNCTPCDNCGYTGHIAYAKFSDVVVIALNNGTVLYKDVEVCYCPECGDTKNDSSVE